tara:strand:- start:1587 stop:1709 length:123 start_codon:yes stop_codon:yes gene_type:complete
MNKDHPEKNPQHVERRKEMEQRHQDHLDKMKKDHPENVKK